ncbi:MAG: redox-sensitive transcriptional activator SoxR [Pelagibacterium sp. SCN 64-44]|nr:MAG: redox-sensitive transcriptional activator SoxR [Pelagibacterium sp. SCN 64-44]
MLQSLLSVGEVARRSGVAVSALHFYERKGLIQSIRTAGNQRRYERSVLRRVAVIQVAQSVGMSLEDIGTALAGLPRDRAPSTRDWEVMSAGWRDSLTARIEQLERLRDGLVSCIGCGCLSTETCPLRNPGDRFGRQGKTGPRILLGD